MFETADSIQQRAENVRVQRASMDKQQEKAAVFNLLHLQQRQSESGDNGNKTNNNNGPKTRRKKSKTTKKATSPSRLKPPPIYPPKKQKRQTLDDLLKAQGVVKPPPPYIVPKVFLRDMRRKRKRHPTADGQFEDPEESRPYCPVSDDKKYQHEVSAQINGNQLRNNAANTANYQLERLEKQAEERRRDLARVTASRLKRQAFATFDPAEDPAEEEEVMVIDDDESSSSKKSGEKDHAGGIYDDAAEVSNDLGRSTATINLPPAAAPALPDAHSLLRQINAAGFQQLPQQTPQGISIYVPPAATPATINVPVLPSAAAAALSPAFAADGLGQNTHLGAAAVAAAQQRLDLQQLPGAWQEIDRAPQMPPVPPDTETKQNPIEVIGPHDILFGRGSSSNVNLGNAWLRGLVQRFRFAYFAAPKGVKRAIAKSIINYVRSKSGRFLYRGKNSLIWYEVGDDKAFDKLSQLLRGKLGESPSAAAAAAKQSQPIPNFPPAQNVAARFPVATPQPQGISMMYNPSVQSVIPESTTIALPIPTSLQAATPAVADPLRQSVVDPLRKSVVDPLYQPVADPLRPNQKKAVKAAVAARQRNFLPLTWEEVDRSPQMAPVFPDTARENPIGTISPKDVLHGRGWHDHVGNVWLRELTQRFHSAYVAAPIKKFMVKSVVNYVRSEGGRFLGKADKKAPSWYEVGDEKAFTKVSQLLSSGKHSQPTADSSIVDHADPQPMPQPLRLSQLLQEGMQNPESPAKKPAKPPAKKQVQPTSSAIHQDPQTSVNQSRPNIDIDACKAHVPPQLWDELLSAPKMSQVQPDTLKNNPIEKIGRSDVSCEEKIWNPGNTWLSELADKFRLAYKEASKSDRSALAKSILNYVRSKKVRFLLKKDSDSSSTWYEGGDTVAYCKILRLLGDGVQAAAEEIEPTVDDSCRAHLPPQLWDEFCKAPKMPPVSADIQKKHPVEIIGPFDVLCGPGNITYENPGNVRLRDMMRELRMAYSAATAKGSKSILMKAAMNYVRFKTGRFLEKEDPKNHYSVWYEGGDKRAMLKCYQVLRCVSKENRYWED